MTISNSPITSWAWDDVKSQSLTMIEEKPNGTQVMLILDMVSFDTRSDLRNESGSKPGKIIPLNMIGYISALNHIHL